MRDTDCLSRFSEVFGAERTPYGAALRHHYADGPPADWRNRFIGAYAPVPLPPGILANPSA